MPQPPELLHARYGAHFGPRVKALRKQAGFSITDFSEKTGLGRRTVYKLEEGLIQNPKLGLLLALQAVLALRSIEELLGDLPDYPSQSYEPAEKARA